MVAQLFPGHEADARLMAEMWLDMTLLLPDGEYGGRSSGLPSGSGGTLGCNVLMHALLVQLLEKSLGREFSWHLEFGDDAVYATDVPIDEVAAAAAEFGFKMSDDKSDDDVGSVHFLQNLHELSFANGRGRRSVNRTLLSMLSYERPRAEWWRGEHDTIRYVMQLEETKNHELFLELVDFWFEHDTIMRQSTPHEVFRQAGGPEVARGIQGAVEYHRSDPAGFEDFAVVARWLELRG